MRYMKVKNSDQPDAWTFADPVGDEVFVTLVIIVVVGSLLAPVSEAL